MAPAHFAGKLQQTIEKRIIAVKPIMLSSISHTNVDHGNIFCCLLVDDVFCHV